MHSNPLDAYQNVEKNSLEGRALEAFVLTKAANFLQSVQNGWDAQDRKEQLDEALRYNLRIWSLLQAEMTNAENPLPAEIKQNLLNLSLFVDRRTFQILMSPDREQLSILIGINRNICAGLRSDAAQTA